jgi:hypothetical protein
MNYKALALLLITALVPAFLSDASAIPRCQRCPYSCSELGLGKKDCSFVSDSGGVCCVDLSGKGDEIADARAKVTSQNTTSCPAGFTPSERRCSDSERSRGCHDQRVGPNRMGCVSSGFR